MTSQDWVETIQKHLPAREAPCKGIIDDALSEHLELRDGFSLARRFPFDLLEFRVDMTA